MNTTDANQPPPDWPLEARISHRIMLYAAQRKTYSMNQFTIEDIVREEISRINSPVAWLHILDTTEGIQENEPWRELSFDSKHPFGEPGEDYSAEYPPPVSIPLFSGVCA